MARPTDTLSLLKDISTGVFTQISYQSRDTEGTQSPIETLYRRSGSCRDFAVLLAEAARVLGFGSRIVSGYLTDPEDEALTCEVVLNAALARERADRLYTRADSELAMYLIHGLLHLLWL